MNNRWKRFESRHKLNADTLFHLLAGSCVTNSIGSYGRQLSTGACDSVEQGDELSLRFISAAFDCKCRYSSKAVLLALADHANDKGICWPSLRRLGQRCSLSRTAVLKHIRYLEKAGFIEIDNTRRCNVYTLRLSTPENRLLTPKVDDAVNPVLTQPSVEHSNLTVKDRSPVSFDSELKLWLDNKGPKPDWVK